mmetsp:Transcript_29732/g.40850  ORF Transcript_29732/g.40850 Transcript_29732/m.40850 type:complete len:283 (+) Transcript_29732:16-864(+)
MISLLIDVLKRMHPSFHEFYMYTASQKFFFFVDPHRRNAISVKKLAHCAIMQELQYLLRAARKLSTSVNDSGEVSKFEQSISANWFSGQNALRIYTLFLELDKDQNGMLSLEELKAFSGFSSAADVHNDGSFQQIQQQFTHTALTRLFEEYIIFQPCEMDYKGFVNFLIAAENIATHKAALQYFWRLIDYDRSNRLTAEKIKYFYKDVFTTLNSMDYKAPIADDVVLEIYDLLSCNAAEGATYQDLVDSKQGHTVVTMLLDVHGFWRYDNRESFLANSPPPS